MTMKQARVRYQRQFSQVNEITKDDQTVRVRTWADRRPSFKAWAAQELKGTSIKSPKLRKIVG